MEDVKKNIWYIYGLGPASEQYRLVHYHPIDMTVANIDAVKALAADIETRHPGTNTYLISNSYDLRSAVRDVIEKKNMESNVVLKVLLETKALKI